jgi:hypothetical protein
LLSQVEPDPKSKPNIKLHTMTDSNLPIPLAAIISICVAIVLITLFIIAAIIKVHRMKASRAHANKLQEEAAINARQPATVVVEQQQQQQQQQPEQQQDPRASRTLPWGPIVR